GVMEMRRESEADAKNIEYASDLFVLGMAKVDRALGHPKKVRALVLEVRGANAEPFKPASRQAVEGGPKGAVILKLGKMHGKPVKATEKDIAEALEETLAYPIRLPRVKELAAKAVGDAKEPREKVRRLVKFVHNFIKPSLETTLPRLQDLLKRKVGD